MDMMLVSTIIAAYGRRTALERALASALRQTYTSHEVLVVCDASSASFLRSLDWDDTRVRVFNLSERSGAQYGPNSVGMRHARGDIFAFLNHDDIWLDDHLERVVRSMTELRTDFHFASAAFVQPEQSSMTRLHFDHFNGPFNRWRTAHPVFNVFEPASAWAVKAAFAHRVGAWSRPGAGLPVSVADYVARSRRLGARFSTGSVATVIKVNLHHAHEGLHYSSESPQHRLLERFLTLPAAVIRAEIDADLSPGRAQSERAIRRTAQLHEETLSARLRYAAYLLTGHPGALVPKWLPRLRHRLRSAVSASGGSSSTPQYSNRTGELLRPHPPVASLTAREIHVNGGRADEQDTSQ
jgi:glycosyltransferase involved in cell wall biosynthesis